MQAAHEERLARNETFFREVNERINDIADALGRDESYTFLCECSDPGCAERITLTRQEYEGIRSDGKRFVLAAGHEVGEIERVVQRSEHHVVVKKVGRAGEVAAGLDPRIA
jgi:hypothetical protein